MSAVKILNKAQGRNADWEVLFQMGGSKGLRSGLAVLLVISYFFKRRRSEARRLLILVKSEKWVAGVYYYVILCIFLYV